MLHVVCGVVVRDGEVLVALRGPGMRDPGVWEFAGGKVEPGETPEEALIRELQEELGITVEVGEPITSDSDGRIVLASYWCRIVAGEPVAHEHAELRWVAPEDLRSLAFAAVEHSAVDAVVRALG